MQIRHTTIHRRVGRIGRRHRRRPGTADARVNSPKRGPARSSRRASRTRRGASRAGSNGRAGDVGYGHAALAFRPPPSLWRPAECGPRGRRPGVTGNMGSIFHVVLHDEIEISRAPGEYFMISYRARESRRPSPSLVELAPAKDRLRAGEIGHVGGVYVNLPAPRRRIDVSPTSG